jgi:hypothetical protein
MSSRFEGRLMRIARSPAVPRPGRSQSARTPTVPFAEPEAVAKKFRELIASGAAGEELDLRLRELPRGTMELLRSSDGWSLVGLSEDELLTLAWRFSDEPDDSLDQLGDEAAPR